MLRTAGALTVLLMAGGAVHAQAYPVKPIRLIVPQAPGGSNDIMARYIGNWLSERLGRTVVVDNRPGADGMIGTDIVARSAADGYTILLASSAFTMNPAVRKVPYDPLKAFDWVAMLGAGPIVLTVGPSLPVNTVKEVVAAAKTQPGLITMASAGGFQHFAHALFRSLAGVDMVIVLYRGGFPAMIDVMGGQAHLTIGSIVQAIPQIRAGKLKPLATGGVKRAATLPDLPTIAEAGVAGYDAGNWWALAVPAGTPHAIVARLNAEVATYLGLAETQKRFANDGVEVDVKSPAEIRRMIPADIAKWTAVAKEAGMRAE
jgi:tripartite-type tricarboxylate transporter receptor subunit TctC